MIVITLQTIVLGLLAGKSLFEFRHENQHSLALGPVAFSLTKK